MHRHNRHGQSKLALNPSAGLGKRRRGHSLVPFTRLEVVMSSRCHRGKRSAYRREDAVVYLDTVVPGSPKKAPHHLWQPGILGD